jgi:L-threonylcarbamoyladenylate synthase
MSITAGAPRVVRIRPDAPEPDALRDAAEILARGGLVALPTETVYGLGADARNAAAVRRIFAVKCRPADNPLIVHVADLRGVREIAAHVSPLAERLAARWWPGPLTLVLEATAALPGVTTGGLATVAVRVPDHPVTLALLRMAGIPVAAPSANRSGWPSPTTAEHVAADLGDALDLILDGGPCPVGLESTVVDARGDVPIVLREGAVTREQLGLPAEDAFWSHSLAASPGTRYRHYAPSCRVELAPAGQGAAVASALACTGVTVGLVATEPAPAGVHSLARYTGVADLARRLYATLRAADEAGLDVVVVECVEESGLGRAVMDRLRRAAAR